MRRGFIAEIKAVIKRGTILSVYADEGQVGGNLKQEPTINYEDLISKARKEEKEKLYPKIESLETQNKELVGQCNNYLLKIASLEKQLEQSKTQDVNNEEVTKLQNKIGELEQELTALKEEKASFNREEIEENIRKEYEIKSYLQEKIAENKGDILTVLIETIKGDTKEEIDEAIESAKEKTLLVKKDLGLVDDQGNPISTGVKTSKSGGNKEKEDKVKDDPTSKRPPSANPKSTIVDETFDAEFVRNLDPSSKEYQEFRKKLGLN